MFTPFEAFEQIKEGLCSYLETAYKISHPDVFDERGHLLREIGTRGGAPSIAQDAFVEATPRFPASRFLREVLEQFAHIPLDLVDLAGFGTTASRLPLYDHQAQALEAFFSRRNLIVATGTGSGKTEAFLLPILGDILRQARTWERPTRAAQPGRYDEVNECWLSSRRHERRAPAMRAMVLYPMNALVNDQLQRLRRILATSASEDWQQRNLNGNRIHFGMYTGDTQVPGHWTQDTKQRQWARYVRQVTSTWNGLSEEYRRRGYWPNPNSCEMLNRWDMQAAPPDILVTNYSMLEYMMVRPIEARIFQATAMWLAREPDATFTLVIDEAHTYVGARGTEISYLIRRLKERLNLDDNDERFRCIATSASLPSSEGASEQILRFAGELFDVPSQSFSLITTEEPRRDVGQYIASRSDIDRFSHYFQDLTADNSTDGRDRAATRLIFGDAPGAPSHVRSTELYQQLLNDALINAIRNRTARNATQLEVLRSELFGNIGERTAQMQAIGGALAAGAIAKAEDDPDSLNLLSTRIHLMFRGVPGIWACMDPQCPQVDLRFRNRPSRPVGRLYLDQRPWCECGARVLELFTCRVCGLAFLGGIQDAGGGLWPWTDNLEAGRRDFGDYLVFGVERANPAAQIQYRSTRTTQLASSDDPFARETFFVQPSTTRGQPNPFPHRCSRCNTRRSTAMDSQIIEPLRTKGSKAFSVLIEEAFRTQPAGDIETANHGRKALTFADSRQDAAMLASDLEVDHNRDVLRQIFYRVLISCAGCGGTGFNVIDAAIAGGEELRLACETCGGTGERDGAMPVEALRDATMAFADSRMINPTFDQVPLYFTQLLPEFNPNQREAERHINAAIRDEISAKDIGLEPIGLASWHAVFDPARVSAFAPLTHEESCLFIDNIVRLLAAENVLLPPTLDNTYWRDIVDRFEQRFVIPDSPDAERTHPWLVFDLSGDTKLGRYAHAVGSRLIDDGRLINFADVEQWISGLTSLVYRSLLTLRLLTPDASNRGAGININRFQLMRMPQTAVVCAACRYIMRAALLDVCIRCGHRTQPLGTAFPRNYYFRHVLFASNGAVYPDPFSLRVKEHTAQIEKPEARRTELKFQDVFTGNQNPDDERVDVLSVTTTMEMGIDIGSLSAVGLRNIPPTVANYQQRAGRAGRRGNAVATVVGFAQQRSHDQYYFSDPPRIVSDPPRVPSLQVENNVIAQRHVRAVVLQHFFAHWPASSAQTAVAGVLNAWGDIRTFRGNDGRTALLAFVNTNRSALQARCERVVPAALAQRVPAWIGDIPSDVASALQGRADEEDVLGILLDRALLPRHAFPIDVVALYTEARPFGSNDRERGIQRDLGVALSEFAPGAELVRDKRIYQIAGLYDPFNSRPQFQPTNKFVECRSCGAPTQIPITDPDASACEVCRSTDLSIMPVIRPTGFCSDWSINGGSTPYRGGGRERIGSVTPAQLTVGEYSYASNLGTRPRYAPSLVAAVAAQRLHVVNRGEPTMPGFEICPVCGRSLEQGVREHVYPADIPPHGGRRLGPRAGSRCPHSGRRGLRSILGHEFPTEVIQIGIDLPPTLEADMRTVPGKALWYSFGMLLRNAAARRLQVGTEELRVGVRAAPLAAARVSGEVFIYDALPGGAGHARTVMQELEEILNAAEEDAAHCTNPECSGACYSCLLSYDNQAQHGLLDRGLAADMLTAARGGSPPALSDREVSQLASRLVPFALDSWTEQQNARVGTIALVPAFTSRNGHRWGAILRRTIQAPQLQQIGAIRGAGYHCDSYTAFDVNKRPYWVIQSLASAP